MPKIRRHKLPEPLLVHLMARMRRRHISHEQIILLVISPFFLFSSPLRKRATADLEIADRQPYRTERADLVEH